MTPEQYCDTLTVIAMRLAAAVRDEGPADVAAALAAAEALPAPDGINPAAALAVILAAAIPTDRTRTQLWGWTLGIPDGPAAIVPTGAAANRFAVEMALAGHLPLHALADAEQTRVIDLLVDTRGWTLAAVAAHLDADPETVRQIRRASTRHRTRNTRKAAA